ncbi:MAG: hypothetical protein KC766_30060 [Myxococcales bacterium]|nr:hypothetical protein [Myxococcales bacterium]
MRSLGRSELGLGLVAVALLMTVGCKKDEAAADGDTASPAVSTTAAAPASAADQSPPASPSAAPGEEQLCQVEKEKSWGKWVN